MLKPPFMSMCARAISSGRQDQALRRSHLHSADVACECPILVTTVWNRKQSIPYCENNAGHLEIEVLHTHTHTHTYTGFISMTTGHGFPMNINSNSLREKELEHRRGEQNATERKYNKTNEQSNSFFFVHVKCSLLFPV